MIEILRKRRSVRSFEERPVEEAKVKILREALLRSPSSRSLNPWEFVIVTDSRILGDLSRCKSHGASFLADAPLGVVILGNTQKSDTCIEDCSIAAITLQYAAESIGLSSCWCQVRLRPHGEGVSAEEYVRRLLGIGPHFLVECIVALGYPNERPSPHGEDELDWKKIRD